MKKKNFESPFRIATEKTILALPESKIGFFTESYFVAKLRSNIGMYIALTSEKLFGEDVYSSGFANYYVNSSDIPEIYQRIEQNLSSSQNHSEMIDSILKEYMGNNK